MVYIILIFSLVINAVLIWYARRLITDLYDLSQQVEEVVIDLQVYGKHIEGIYGLQAYHGDETLMVLVEHTKEIAARMSSFSTMFSDTETQDETDDDEEAGTPEQVSQEEKHVFYAGARRRNS